MDAGTRPINVYSSSYKPELWDWPLQYNDEGVHVRNRPDRWEVGLDAGAFTSDEIEVLLSGDNLFIYCHHDEPTNMSACREVKRSYKLPDDVDRASIRSHRSDSGILRIMADKKYKKMER